jgi:hypothetical protein
MDTTKTEDRVTFTVALLLVAALLWIVWTVPLPNPNF